MSLTSIHLPSSIKIEFPNKGEDFSNVTSPSIELFSSRPLFTPTDENILSPNSFSSEDIEPIQIEEEEKHVSASALKEFLKTLEAAEIVKSSTSGLFLTATALLVIGFLAFQNDSLVNAPQTPSSPPSPCFNITAQCPSPTSPPQKIAFVNPIEETIRQSITTDITDSYFKECSNIAKLVGNIFLGYQQACIEIQKSALSNNLLSHTYILNVEPNLASLIPFNGTSSLYDRINITCKQVVDILKHPNYNPFVEKFPTDCHLSLLLNNAYHTPYKGTPSFKNSIHQVIDLSSTMDLGTLLKAFEAYTKQGNTSLIMENFV